MGAGLAGRPPCLPHSQVLIGAGLARRPPCLPHSQVLIGAGLARRPPCLPHSQVLMGAGLSGDLPVYHTVRSLCRDATLPLFKGIPIFSTPA